TSARGGGCSTWNGGGRGGGDALLTLIVAWSPDGTPRVVGDEWAAGPGRRACVSWSAGGGRGVGVVVGPGAGGSVVRLLGGHPSRGGGRWRTARSVSAVIWSPASARGWVRGTGTGDRRGGGGRLEVGPLP